MMTDKIAFDFITKIFHLIQNSKTIEELETIPYKLKILSKNSMNIDSYPKIEFDIKTSEIQTLIDTNLIDKELNFERDISKK